MIKSVKVDIFFYYFNLPASGIFHIIIIPEIKIVFSISGKPIYSNLNINILSVITANTIQGVSYEIS